MLKLYSEMGVFDEVRSKLGRRRFEFGPISTLERLRWVEWDDAVSDRSAACGTEGKGASYREIIEFRSYPSSGSLVTVEEGLTRAESSTGAGDVFEVGGVSGSLLGGDIDETEVALLCCEAVKLSRCDPQSVAASEKYDWRPLRDRGSLSAGEVTNLCVLFADTGRDARDSVLL